MAAAAVGAIGDDEMTWLDGLKLAWKVAWPIIRREQARVSAETLRKRTVDGLESRCCKATVFDAGWNRVCTQCWMVCETQMKHDPRDDAHDRLTGAGAAVLLLAMLAMTGCVSLPDRAHLWFIRAEQKEAVVK